MNWILVCIAIPFMVYSIYRWSGSIWAGIAALSFVFVLGLMFEEFLERLLKMLREIERGVNSR